MATLNDLLALLQDNTSGEITAADMRTIVSDVWNLAVVSTATNGNIPIFGTDSSGNTGVAIDSNYNFANMPVSDATNAALQTKMGTPATAGTTGDALVYDSLLGAIWGDIDHISGSTATVTASDNVSIAATNNISLDSTSGNVVISGYEMPSATGISEQILAVDTVTSSLYWKTNNSDLLIVTAPVDLDAMVTDVAGKLDLPTNDAGGTVGHVLTKTAIGTEWQPGGSGGGASSLNDLTDVTLNTSLSGQTLIHNGTVYANRALVKSDISNFNEGDYEPDLGDPASDGMVLSSLASGTRSWITMTSTLNALDDVDNSAPADKDVLKYSASTNNYVNSQLTKSDISDFDGDDYATAAQGLAAETSVQSVNGISPVAGNVSLSVIGTHTGTEAERLAFTPVDTDVWIVAGDPVPANDGKMYIYSSSDTTWHEISTLDTAAGDARYVNITGDGMTGDLLLNSDPTTASMAATKRYVDDSSISLTQGVNDPSVAGTNVGDLYLRDSVNFLSVWDGSSWLEVGSDGIVKGDSSISLTDTSVDTGAIQSEVQFTVDGTSVASFSDTGVIIEQGLEVQADSTIADITITGDTIGSTTNNVLVSSNSVQLDANTIDLNGLEISSNGDITSSNNLIIDATSLTLNNALNVSNNIISNVSNPISDNDAATKIYVDSAISPLVSAITHNEAVHDVRTSSPSVPTTGALYIINGVGTSDFAGQDNNLAEWSGSAWVFTTPLVNETHLNLADNKNYNWNGTTWVVVSDASNITGGTSNGVGEIVGWPLTGTLPDDLLELTGQVLVIANYTDLYAVVGNTYNSGTSADGVTTFALPDYRGYTLKGVGLNSDGSGDAGFTAGDKQQDQNKEHKHDLNYGTETSVFANLATTFSLGGNTWSSDVEAGNAPSTAMDNSGGTEVRVKSIGTRWCIRYKGINAGVRGPKGEGYADGTSVGQILEWNGTSWIPTAQPLGLVYDHTEVGDRAYGTIDTYALHSVAGAKYKISAHYSSTWAHDTNSVDIQVMHNGSAIASTRSSPSSYAGSETTFAIFNGTGNVETFDLQLFGSGGTLHGFTWLIERIQ